MFVTHSRCPGENKIGRETRRRMLPGRLAIKPISATETATVPTFYSPAGSDRLIRKSSLLFHLPQFKLHQSVGSISSNVQVI